MSLAGRLSGAMLARYRRWRADRRRAALVARGLRLGHDVWLPDSTWIDEDHCHLIAIGDHTGFGEQCMLLAHDAQMDEFLDAARIGRVDIRESCHIGARTVILPGVTLGPRTVVGASSVVARTLPPDTVCAGNPAQVICALDEYLDRHRDRLSRVPTFPYEVYGTGSLSALRRAELIEACAAGHAYITGGRSAELRGEGGTPRTTR